MRFHSITIKTALFLLLLTCSVSNQLTAKSYSPVSYQKLFVSGKRGYDTYRIPSIIVTPEGTILAVCEGRKNSRKDNGDIDLLIKRSVDGARTWSKQKVIWNDGNNTCGNPCMVIDSETDTVFLFSTWNNGADTEKHILTKTGKDTRRVFYLKSNDDGKSWTKPVEITEDAKAPHWRWYATGPGVGIQLKKGPKKGRLIMPCDHSFPEYAPDQKYGAHAIYSDDHGKTWKYSDPILPGLNENQVVELIDGKLMMNLRNHLYRGTRGLAFSTDGGETWPYVAYESNLQEPRCQASIIRYSPNKFINESILLFSNPDNNAKRINMTVKLSADEGKTWPLSKSIHPGPSAYSCLSVLPNGKIACFYEAGRKMPYETITLAIFDIDWLTSGKIKIKK